MLQVGSKAHAYFKRICHAGEEDEAGNELLVDRGVREHGTSARAWKTDLELVHTGLSLVSISSLRQARDRMPCAEAESFLIRVALSPRTKMADRFVVIALLQTRNSSPVPFKGCTLQADDS